MNAPHSVTLAPMKVFGIVLPVRQLPRQLFVQRTHFVGLTGESEIRIGQGGRPLDVPMIVFGDGSAGRPFRTSAALQNFIESELTYLWPGFHGTLRIADDAGHPPYENCTFHGAETLDCPKLDVAGTLDGGYFVPVVLHFYQLK